MSPNEYEVVLEKLEKDLEAANARISDLEQVNTELLSSIDAIHDLTSTLRLAKFFKIKGEVTIPKLNNKEIE
jgi:hypothetical protein